MLANETLFISDLWITAFVAYELSNFIIDYRLISSQIITTLMCLTLTFGADEYFEALVNLFSRDLSKVSKTNITIGLKNFFVQFFIFS